MVTQPSVLLCADIGNSAIKLAVVSPANNAIISCQRFPHPQLARQPETIAWPEVNRPIEGIMVASVTNAAQTQAWLDALQQQYQAQSAMSQSLSVRTLVPSQRNPFGIDLNHYPAEQLGADRYSNLVTARAQQPNTPCIMVDAGTATTIDWLDADGTYAGGVILPGPDTLTNSLQQATARLPRVSLRWTDTYPGHTTQQCLETGLATGYVGMLAANLERGPFQPSSDGPLILTGGHASTIAALFKAANHPLVSQMALAPHWTVQGLAAAWHVYQSSPRLVAANPVSLVS